MSGWYRAPAVVRVAAVCLAAAFWGGLLVAGDGADGTAAPGRVSPQPSTATSPSPPEGAGQGSEPSGDAAAAGHDEHAPTGLATAQQGYRLRLGSDILPRGERVPFRFTILAPDGAPLHDYAVTHEKELHLIVVRRDLSGYQHVHPVRAPDGTWSTELRLPSGGTYRVFADFAPTALGGPLALGGDVHVAGRFEPAVLPQPAPTARVGRYDVALSTTDLAAEDAVLSFTVTRDGEPVADLQPYLGALGHLVTLRTTDLAYLHAHASSHGTAGRGPDVTFSTSFPSPGTYRLFLDFQHAGVVRTAELTVVVGEPATPRQHGH